MRYHFMGIGGIGMSGIAQILLEDGHTVSGCDLSPSELAYRLEVRGARILRGHGADHIDVDLDVLVTSTAVPHDHPEVAAARELGKRVVRRIEVLGEMMAGHDSIGVVGTHGKTTTTSMIATVFQRAGHDPTAVIGGEVGDIGGNARRGRGRHFIAEVDESDTLFQHLRPRTAVVTNVEDDHIALPGDLRSNYHASMDDLLDAFRRFAAAADVAVYCADWKGLGEIVAKAGSRVSYGTVENADYRATGVVLEGGRGAYTLERRGETLGRIELSVPGLHNVLNSVAAAAVADLAGIPFAAVAEALAAFRGAHRRWERVGSVGGAWVVDDYAHHPTEVSATLAAARSTGRRVRVVFQPHRFLRTAQTWERSAQALMAADDVLLLDVYSAGEAAIEGVHSSLIEAKLRADGHLSARYYPERAELVHHLQATAADGEVIVTMGAGDVWKIGTALVARDQGVEAEIGMQKLAAELESPRPAPEGVVP